jgi:hypothetical protein
MIIAHAIIGQGGLAALLVAAIALIIVAVALTVSVVARNKRRLTQPEAVPLWWDQSSVPSSSGPKVSQGGSADRPSPGS